MEALALATSPGRGVIPAGTLSVFLNAGGVCADFVLPDGTVYPLLRGQASIMANEKLRDGFVSLARLLVVESIRRAMGDEAADAVRTVRTEVHTGKPN